MAAKFLIDTSVVIKYLKEILPAEGNSLLDNILDEESNISFITEIELLAWNLPHDIDLDVYKLFIDNSNVIGIYSSIISKTIEIRKTHNIKLPDAIIAATALVNNMTLVADNDKDFKKVTELKYINPSKLIS
ncbi:type II toxin-antitoxin system VapC family toxin [uncultured Mucilaginibacter sp.]|uniref:type II toxin-antitoxin system VapC family toxin n=1 Tax=uncultured Mucilaginibacter sp. TaxID=797541 RepID=UPI0025FBAD86|nr:type II toxin-antitoxin system VapC family toxin [uncultured Mucilaginibacter sp.]